MKPSRFILNSDYATLKNDAEGAISLTIPSLVNIPEGGADVVYKSQLQIGSKSAGIRTYVTSTKYNWALTSQSFQIYCKQNGVESGFVCDIFRPSSDKVEIRVTFSGGWGEGDGTKYTDMGQTLTLHVKTFINPFE